MTGEDAPIGVFDSGVGGLTVLAALRAALPAENFIYLGDTARLPYGTKSAATVQRYSLQCADALFRRGIRCLVVACNTASASALSVLQSRHPHIPVFGVIEPGAAAAVALSRSRHIVVIGTESTIDGGAYQAAIHRLGAEVRVTAGACPLFVALAEEGWTHGPIAESIARRYLQPLFSAAAPQDVMADAAPDTLVLGCTHFPALAGVIAAVLPARVHVVDSAATMALTVARALAVPPCGVTRRRAAIGGAVRWLATDGAARFARVSGNFLGEPLRADDIEIIDL